MAIAPGRVCGRCGRVHRGRCRTAAEALDRRRGSQRARGYDVRWEHLRDRHRAAFPLCARCLARGLVVPMREVDHIVPFVGLEDPRRLDPENLQSLCGACHREKTRAEHR